MGRAVKTMLQKGTLLIYLFVRLLIGIGDGTRFVILAPVFTLIFLGKFLRAFYLRYDLKRYFRRFLRLHIPKRKFLRISVVFHWVIKQIRVIFRIRHFFLLKLRFFLLGFVSCLFIVFFIQAYIFIHGLPSPTTIGKVNFPLSTHIYDRKGRLLYEVYREQNRTPVSIEKLSPHLIHATIAIEDKDFYYHRGISLISGVLRAIKEIVKTKNLQGGSTITQQLVKTALLTPERTFQRKLKEMILALWTEQIFSKQEILEMYLNQVPYGGSSYGIEEAAKTYFGKHADELILSEAAFLAGLPQAPSLYSPYVNPDYAISRRNEVLEKMYEQKYITQEEKKEAQKTPLATLSPRQTIKAPHFVFYVKSNLEDLYGIQQVEEGGLKVITTLDLDIQEEVERIVQEELAKIKALRVSNAGVLITRPSTGEILSMVGSLDYFASPSGAFNVTTALRQPGSAIKPILYALALEKGYTAATILDDSPITFSTSGSKPYTPVNYDNKFHGRIPLRYALANSYNVPAVKTLNTLGIDTFINNAKNFGISTWSDPSRFGLSLTLGGGEVTMVDMATAFGIMANRGEKVLLQSIGKIEKIGSGASLSFTNPGKTRVLDEGIAFIISDILADPIARQEAFGKGSLLEIPGYTISVKTGTTDQKKDNWTIGYTPEFLVAVWVGNNDNSPMDPHLTSGITGAAPIWNRVMKAVFLHYQQKDVPFQKPDTVVEKTCSFGRKEYFIKGTERNASCVVITPTPHP